MNFKYLVKIAKTNYENSCCPKFNKKKFFFDFEQKSIFLKALPFDYGLPHMGVIAVLLLILAGNV